MLKKRLPGLTNLLKHRFLQIAFFGLVLAGAATMLFRVAPSKAQEPQPKSVGQISLLVEKGFVLPPQSLARQKTDDFAAVGDSTRLIVIEPIESPQQLGRRRSLDVTFSITGDARFEDKAGQGLLTVTSAEGGVIRTPAIEAAPHFGESFLQALVDGQPVVEKLRVATLEAGGIENLKKYLSGDDDPAILAMGDHYAVIDESRMRVTEETVTVEGTDPAEAIRVGLPERTDPNASSQNLAAGLCIRTPFGPGKVKWTWDSPAAYPWRYSIKPECCSNLRWASAPADDIDAIYRRSWGCGTALKVPNSCTLTWNSNGSWSSCCNAAAWVAGHRPQWVNPSQHGFPYCPL